MKLKGLSGAELEDLQNTSPPNTSKQPRKFSWQHSNRDELFCPILPLAVIAMCLCICLPLIADSPISKSSFISAPLLNLYHIYILQFFFSDKVTHCKCVKNSHSWPYWSDSRAPKQDPQDNITPLSTNFPSALSVRKEKISLPRL